MIGIDQLCFRTNPWEIRIWPDDPSLRLTAREVTEFDDGKLPVEQRELHQLVMQMGVAMQQHGGAGLAAPQVGVQKRLFVLADEKKRDGSCFAFVNPRLLAYSDERVGVMEGCLSLPNVHVEIERPVEIVVEHETVFGKTVQVEAGGVHARVIQHEIDHLDGILITDYLGQPEKRVATASLVMMLADAREQQHRRMQEMMAGLTGAGVEVA